MHKGEYRYSSSPLGKRIDIYETSETEDYPEEVINASKNQNTNSVKKLKTEVEEEIEHNRMPTLCTFDVRDKKTSFQTSCYVKRDIMGSNGIDSGIFGENQNSASKGFVP